jgi:hypothetical protein
MVERARVRCPVCRAAVPVTVLWSVGGRCPGCSQPLEAARRGPSAPDGVLGKTSGLLRVESAGKFNSTRDLDANVEHADGHTAGDTKHLAAVARSLRSADAAAGREDYGIALGWLRTVEATGEGLSAAYETSRRMWQLAVDADRPAD